MDIDRERAPWTCLLVLTLLAAACADDPEPARAVDGGGADATPRADGAASDGSGDGANNGTTGGDSQLPDGCYDCRGSFLDRCSNFRCDADEPCDAFIRRDDQGSSGGTGVSNPPSYEHPETGGDCILKALQAGTPGAYNIQRNPGAQYADHTTLYVLSGRRAVQVESHAMDNGGNVRERARSLRAPGEYDACFADEEAMWACLLDPLDESACYTATPPACERR